MLKIQEILAENRKRRSELFEHYDPYRGIGSPISRFEFVIDAATKVFLPDSMANMDLIKASQKLGGLHKLSEHIGLKKKDLANLIHRKRLKHDFEFWAATCATIFNKETRQPVKFTLRRPQRKLLGRLEAMRLAGKPIRVVICKARQWGGSTLVLLYMMWLQSLIKENWNSCIVADVETQARNIRGMYRKAAKHYPSDVGSITLAPFEGDSKNIQIQENGCVISIGSMQKPESLRSADLCMSHMSEVGLWRKTEGKAPEDVIQTIRGSILEMPDTLIAIESTAKGRGNFFHEEYMRAKNKTSNYDAVFVAWWEIELYQKDLDMDPEEFIKSWTEYEEYLWSLGATIEGINWYRYKFYGEMMEDEWRMKSEFPSDDNEAFQFSGKMVIPPVYLRNIQETVCEPIAKGELTSSVRYGADSLNDVTFTKATRGNLWLWAMPDKITPVTNRYCVFADIGGTTKGADYSCARVLDRYWLMHGGVPIMVATWHGHLDQDLFAWEVAKLGRFFNDALVAIEVNSLREKGKETDHSYTILNEISDHYDNLFIRPNPEKIKENLVQYGFITNRKTKTMIFDNLVGKCRDRGYEETDARAIHELSIYEERPDGSMGNAEGKDNHDDIAVCTAGANWLSDYMELPKYIKGSRKEKTKHYSEATF